MSELNTMDLDGAPVAYTPFCDSRKEMDGFRFWKTGYVASSCSLSSLRLPSPSPMITPAAGLTVT